MICALAGGVGAAKFLRGLRRVMPEDELTVIVNTADDIDMWGLHVSPDLDTITYSLAGAADFERGWGLAAETWQCRDSVGRYGLPDWFSLGDKDLATHLYRTSRLAAGRTLSQVTAEIAEAWDIGTTILPMTDDPVESRIIVKTGDDGSDGRLDLHFEEYLIERGSTDTLETVAYRGAETARPTPQALAAVENADGIIFCPSNPVVSIGPILAIDRYRDLIERRHVPAVGISPIVGGTTVRGPADKLMAALDIEVSCSGVAQIYKGLLDTLFIDDVDEELAGSVAASGIKPVVAQTLMSDTSIAADLAGRVLDSLGHQ